MFYHCSTSFSLGQIRSRLTVRKNTERCTVADMVDRRESSNSGKGKEIKGKEKKSSNLTVHLKQSQFYSPSLLNFSCLPPNLLVGYSYFSPSISTNLSPSLGEMYCMQIGFSVCVNVLLCVGVRACVSFCVRETESSCEKAV